VHHEVDGIASATTNTNDFYHGLIPFEGISFFSHCFYSFENELWCKENKDLCQLVAEVKEK
jgi:hypothetical protein